jgi:riboflavin synthase
MFTGIIEELGTVERLDSRTTGARIRVRCRKILEDLSEGASIAVNGVCLTGVELGPDSFSADISPETLRASNLAELRARSLVNLERPLSPSGRLGGHIVQGHVDGTGEFLSLEALGDENWWLKVRVPPELDRYIVYKGSIAIDGISLTVASFEEGVMAVTVVPHSYQSTNLRTRQPGERVNLECDILAKYVEKLLASRGAQREATPRLTIEQLKEMGY